MVPHPCLSYCIVGRHKQLLGALSHTGRVRRQWVESGQAAFGRLIGGLIPEDESAVGEAPSLPFSSGVQHRIQPLERQP